MTDIQAKVDDEGYGKLRIGEQWYAVMPFNQLSQNQLLRTNVGSGDLGVFPRDWKD